MLEQLTQAGITVVGSGRALIMDGEGAQRAHAALQQATFDLLILLQASFADSSMAVELAQLASGPQAPVLLPIDDVAAISWQGSAGAQSYIVERAEKKNGPWTEIGRNVCDAAVPYRPLFADADVQIAGQYFYRVTAQNSSGASGPSNTVGPVAVRHFTLVDEMRDFSLLHQHTGVTPETGKTRNAKEDMDRMKGAAGAALVYRLPAAIRTCTVYTFFAEEPADLRFQVSADGQTWQTAEARRKDFYSGEGQYGYWKPVRYEAKPQALQSRFIRIEFTGEAQISRIEITYGGAE